MTGVCFFRDVFKFSVRGLDNSKPDARETALHSECLEAFQLETSYHQLTGKWSRINARHLDDEDTFSFMIQLVYVLMEPCRLLTSFWGASCDVDLNAPQLRMPPMLDALNKSTSVLFWALQYWSTLVINPRSMDRLAIVYTCRGCVTYDEWERLYPNDIKLLCQGAQTLCASVEARQQQRNSDDAFKCLKLFVLKR